MRQVRNIYRNKLAGALGLAALALFVPAVTAADIKTIEPGKLAIAWSGSGDVSFELEPKGKEVLLTVIHRRLPDRATMLMFGAGWHMHLDILVARATGKEPEPFWDGWSRLRKEYDRRMPA